MYEEEIAADDAQGDNTYFYEESMEGIIDKKLDDKLDKVLSSALLPLSQRIELLVAQNPTQTSEPLAPTNLAPPVPTATPPSSDPSTLQWPHAQVYSSLLKLKEQALDQPSPDPPNPITIPDTTTDTEISQESRPSKRARKRKHVSSPVHPSPFSFDPADIVHPCSADWGPPLQPWLIIW